MKSSTWTTLFRYTRFFVIVCIDFSIAMTTSDEIVMLASGGGGGGGGCGGGAWGGILLMEEVRGMGVR